MNTIAVNDASAIQIAIDTLHQQGGGRVSFGPGTYACGTIDSDSPLQAKFVNNLSLNDVNLSAKLGPASPLAHKDSHSWEAKF